jgi:phosphoribosylanthranilate isomerase
VIVKICGLKRKEDLQLAKICGANVVGIICGVPESPRSNTVKECIEIQNSIDGIDRAVLFRNHPLEKVIEATKQFHCEILHFCGDEGFSYREKIKEQFSNISIWQSVGVPVENVEDIDWLKRTKAVLDEKNVDVVVLDSQKSGKTGGTGISFPFKSVANKLGEDQKRIVIAGGLKEAVLPELYNNLSPLGLDVSSGIEESPGVKSKEKMTSFFTELSKYK